MKYTIGITTFVDRFDSCLKPLVTQIKSNLPDVELIIYVNGQLDGFDENYRRDMLLFLSENKNTFPIFSPHFKGLSKMWNSIIVQSSNDKIFILNDDVYLHDEFFYQINQMLDAVKTSFRLNGSCSHFCVDRKEVFEVGFFDERLIGLGEEDGDWVFRWERIYQRHIISIQTDAITRYHGYSSSLKEIPWNTNWIFKNKYDPDNYSLAMTQGFPANCNNSIYGKPVAIIEDIDLNLYPFEKFYWEHISELNENFGIKKVQ